MLRQLLDRFRRPKGDALDGCELDFLTETAVSDADLDAHALFGDLDPADREAVAQRQAEWRAIFKAEDGDA